MQATTRRRTINMSAERSQSIALAAAALGISSERWIQAAIDAALITVAEHNAPLGAMLSHLGDAEWQMLAEAAKAGAEAKA